MNFLDLERYITDLKQSGFDGTVKLQVRFYRKFSRAAVRADHGDDRDPVRFPGGESGSDGRHWHEYRDRDRVPGDRPAVREAGRRGQLPPAMAAWAPDVLFSLAGLYLMLRMRS